MTLQEKIAALQCPDCKNEFVQPFRCTTCGAQKLYDATVTSLQERNDSLMAYNALLCAQLNRAVRMIEGHRRAGWITSGYGLEESTFLLEDARAVLSACEVKQP